MLSHRITVINKNDYTLFEKKNNKPKIAEMVLYMDVTIEILKFGKTRVLLYINQLNNHMYVINTTKKKIKRQF